MHIHSLTLYYYYYYYYYFHSIFHFKPGVFSLSHTQIYGGDGDDLIMGEAGKDVLYGEAGNDTLMGGKKTDKIFGGQGADVLMGNNGPDILAGGEGDDIVTGGGLGEAINESVDAHTHMKEKWNRIVMVALSAQVAAWTNLEAAMEVTGSIRWTRARTKRSSKCAADKNQQQC